MSDKEMKAMVKRLSTKSAKKIAEENKKSKGEPDVLHEYAVTMTKAAFEEYAAKCSDRKVWPGSVIGYKCGLTEFACRDCICPELNKNSVKH